MVKETQPPPVTGQYPVRTKRVSDSNQSATTSLGERESGSELVRHSISSPQWGLYAPSTLSVSADNSAPPPLTALQGCLTTCSAVHQGLVALQIAPRQLVCQSWHTEPQPPPCQTHASQPASMQFHLGTDSTCKQQATKPMCNVGESFTVRHAGKVVHCNQGTGDCAYSDLA